MLFPKPQKRPKQKRNRELDKAYTRWIHGWPCANPSCGKWPVHSHHVDKKSRLGSDRSQVPLCASCHIGKLHTRGEETCAREWGIDFKELVAKFNGLYNDGEMGPYDHLLSSKSYSSR